MPSTTVYKLHDAEGELLYVGITEREASRMGQHAECKAWWSEVAAARFEHYPTRQQAADRERELVAAERPRHSVRLAVEPAPMPDRWVSGSQSGIVIPDLAAVRQQRGLRREALAKKSGVALSSIMRVEKGGHARYVTVHKLAEVLGVPAEELAQPVGDTDEVQAGPADRAGA